MPITNEQRVKILKAAKPLLDHSRYVCYAVGDAAYKDLISETECESFTVEIMNRIFPCKTVAVWLRDYHHGVWQNLTHRKSSKEKYENFLAYRHAWIDNMILEFSA